MGNHHLEELSEQYLSEKNIAPVTLKTYRIVFKHYISYLKDNNIEYAKTSDVIHYRESKRRIGYSSQWIYIQMSALKGFYRYLRLNQKRLNLSVEYAYDIMVSVKNERIKHRIKKPILTINQAKHLILHTKHNRQYIWHYRDHAIIYLMLTSGLRSKEIVHVKKVDYQVVDGKPILYVKKKGKRSDQEFVKLAEGAKEALDDYLNKRKDNNPYLFISHRQISKEGHLSRVFFIDMFDRVLKDCGLEESGITPHCLRHTAAAMNLLRGGSIEQTRELMRHKDIKSTLVYVEHIDRMEDDSEHQIEQFILNEESFSYSKDNLYILLE